MKILNASKVKPDKEEKEYGNPVRIRPDLFQKCVEISGDRQKKTKELVRISTVVNEILEKGLL